jgi:hypothetical protein
MVSFDCENSSGIMIPRIRLSLLYRGRPSEIRFEPSLPVRIQLRDESIPREFCPADLEVAAQPGVMAFDVEQPAIVGFELALNQEIGAIAVRGFRKQDLEAVASAFRRYAREGELCHFYPRLWTLPSANVALRWPAPRRASGVTLGGLIDEYRKH